MCCPLMVEMSEVKIKGWVDVAGHSVRVKPGSYNVITISRDANFSLVVHIYKINSQPPLVLVFEKMW